MCEWKEESIIVDGDVTIAPPYGVTDVSGENEEHVNEVKERVSFYEEIEDVVIKYEIVLIHLLKQSPCNECCTQTIIPCESFFLFPLYYDPARIKSELKNWHNDSTMGRFTSPKPSKNP